MFPLFRRRFPRPLLAVALCGAFGGAAFGCAGGQTGEITMLGPCGELHGERSIESLSENEAAALDALVGEHEHALVWERGGETRLRLSVSLDEERALRDQGEAACLALRVPLRVAVFTDDGTLDESLVGSGVLAGAGVRSFVASGVAPFEGELEAEAMELIVSGESLSRGQLFLKPLGDEGDEEPLGRW